MKINIDTDELTLDEIQSYIQELELEYERRKNEAKVKYYEGEIKKIIERAISDNCSVCFYDNGSQYDGDEEVVFDDCYSVGIEISVRP